MEVKESTSTNNKPSEAMKDNELTATNANKPMDTKAGETAATGVDKPEAPGVDKATTGKVKMPTAAVAQGFEMTDDVEGAQSADSQEFKVTKAELGLTSIDTEKPTAAEAGEPEAENLEGEDNKADMEESEAVQVQGIEAEAATTATEDHLVDTPPANKAETVKAGSQLIWKILDVDDLVFMVVSHVRCQFPLLSLYPISLRANRLPLTSYSYTTNFLPAYFLLSTSPC